MVSLLPISFVLSNDFQHICTILLMLLQCRRFHSYESTVWSWAGVFWRFDFMKWPKRNVGTRKFVDYKIKYWITGIVESRHTRSSKQLSIFIIGFEKANFDLIIINFDKIDNTHFYAFFQICQDQNFQCFRNIQVTSTNWLVVFGDRQHQLGKPKGNNWIEFFRPNKSRLRT